MEGANEKELHQLEEASQVLLFRDVLPGSRHVDLGLPPQRGRRQHR